MSDPTVREIIDARGGYKAVAEALSTPERSFPLTTVHSWWRANRLPDWRRAAVMAIPEQPGAATPPADHREEAA